MQISFSGLQPDANFIQWAASQMQISFSGLPAECKKKISFSGPPARCKFHSVGCHGRKFHSVGCHGCKFHTVGRQPDANYILLAALQYKIPKFINSLHAAGDQPNEICIQLAAPNLSTVCMQLVTNQMKFASSSTFLTPKLPFATLRTI
jgi:hypothetical protein